MKLNEIVDDEPLIAALIKQRLEKSEPVYIRAALFKGRGKRDETGEFRIYDVRKKNTHYAAFFNVPNNAKEHWAEIDDSEQGELELKKEGNAFYLQHSGKSKYIAV